MSVLITANAAQFNAALTQMNNRLSGFENFAKGAAKSLVGLFAVQRVASFTLEISKLAGEAQGVNEAFRRLPENVKLLDALKEATSGTVSELDLMRRSVQAANFGISLNALPQLLEFAAIRAKQTGESVDYLVNSIVTGIGRKSKLILDNLGISAVELTEALGGASTAASTIGEVADAVGKIAEKNLKTMGEMSENASTKLERLNATWINAKIALGDAANSTGILGGAIDGLTTSLDVLSSRDLSFFQKLGFLAGGAAVKSSILLDQFTEKTKKLLEEQKKLDQVLKEVDRAFASGNPEAYINAQKQHIYYTEILAEYNKRLIAQDKEKATGIETIANLTEHLNDLMSIQSEQTGAALIKTNQEIKVIEAKIKALRELGIETDNQARKDKAAALARGEATRGQGVSFSVGGFDTSKIDFTTDPAFDSFTKAQKAIQDSIDASLIKQQEQRDSIIQTRFAFAQFADQVGNSITQVIQQELSLGQAFARVTASILDGIQQRILANIALGSSKAFAANPLLGIAVVTAGFAVAKGLLGMISKSGGGGSYGGGSNFSSSRSSFETATNGSQNSAPTITGVIRGQDLYVILENYKRNNQYTMSGG